MKNTVKNEDLKAYDDSFLPQEKPISEMTWEELLKEREVITTAMEDMEAHLKVLSDEFLFRLQEEKLNGKIVGNHSISKAVRVSFETPIEVAQELGAVKTVVDQTALKKLYAGGVVVQGVKRTEYVMVREIVKKTE